MCRRVVHRFALGHSFGVRVDGPLGRGLWPPNGGRLCSLALRGQRPFGPRVVVSPLRAMSFIMPPSAVTSTSSIIIILTLVHPFATSWPSSPKGDARTLRDWLSVSYVTQYPVPPIFSFPLEGKSRKAGKGVRGRVPIGCSIAILTANRRPPKQSDTQRTHFALCELDL